MNNAICKVVIVGGGTAGWMSAAVLSKAFGRRLDIHLVESEAIGIVGVGEATIPQIRLINQYLGLDEDDFLRAAQGTFKLGIQFNGWTAPDHSYLHAFGEIGRPLGLLGFHHYWLRARHEGEPTALWDYSLNTGAALAGRCARLEQIPDTPFPGIRHAFHFDAALYARYLRRHAERWGVIRHEGRIVNVERDGESGDIARLKLASGKEIVGDFFIDCSGFSALLLGQALNIGYEDWQMWLPCDRAAALPSARTAPLRPYTQANARPAGWQWRIPLQHRTGNGHVYCSRFISDDEAVATLMAHLEGEALGEPRLLRFTAGIREQFWNRNCVAIGLSSGFLEPLESTSIHLIQSAIGRLVQLFPAAHCEPALRDEYNAQTRFEFERIRDFLIFHYWANGRSGEPFWDERRNTPPPPSLVHKVELFRTGGRFFRDGEELFTEGSWVQVLLGQGIVPRRHHPLAAAVERQKLNEMMSGIRTLIAHTVDRMPSHADYIERHCQAAGVT